MSVVWLGSDRGVGVAALEAGIREAVNKDRSFVAGSAGEEGLFPLSGYPTLGGYGGGFGLLDEVWEPFVREAEYVIFSYETPVAWLSAGVWSVPDVYYTNTTARYANRVRGAFGVVRIKPGV